MKRVFASDLRDPGDSPAWVRVIFAVLFGYCLLGRTFAYVGIPQAKLFIGDVVLGAFLLLQFPVLVRYFVGPLVSPSVFSTLAWSVLLFIVYGTVELIRGYLFEYSLLAALQTFVFNVYVLYFFIGLWVGAQSPDLLRRLIRVLAIALAVYGPAYILLLNRVAIEIPGTNVPVFGQASSGLVVIGLLCFERPLGWYWIPLFTNVFIILATQVRSEWVGLLAALTLAAILTRRYSLLVAPILVMAGLLTVGYLVDFRIPSPVTRGGDISTKDIMGRAIGAVDPELAREYTPRAYSYAGTVSWRTRWWSEIWESVHQDPATSLLGFGYGFPLGDLVSYLRGVDIRTPHNVFFYALGYTGWLGVSLFFALQASCATLLYRLFRQTGQLFPLLVWTITVIEAFFGNVFETPSGAISVYLIIGIACAPLLSHTTRALPVPATAQRRHSQLIGYALSD